MIIYSKSDRRYILSSLSKVVIVCGYIVLLFYWWSTEPKVFRCGRWQQKIDQLKLSFILNTL